MNRQRQRYEYQKDGTDWLVQHSGGFLWDEPGLGKTTQAIDAARKLAPGLDDHILVVCPSMLRPHWVREIKELYPLDSVVSCTTAGRMSLGKSEVSLEVYASKKGLPKWVVVHYTGLRISAEEYDTVRWACVVADEAHYIKNRRTKRYKALFKVTPSTAARIGLTATPQSKCPADYWAQLHWSDPTNTDLRSYWSWFNRFVDYSTEYNPQTGAKYKKVSGGKNLEKLAKVLDGFGLARTKREVAPELPPIRDIRVPLEPTDRQKKVYSKMRKKDNVDLGIRDVDGTVVRLKMTNILARMTRMEQWLSHPWTMQRSEKGSKLLWVEEWKDGYPYPAVIMTRFKESANRLAELLGTTPITGDTNRRTRQRVLDEWTSGPQHRVDHLPENERKQFLVGTAQVLGTGLNLQRAYCLVCYDTLWHSIVMQQARERVHRIVSDHPVDVYWLDNTGTTNSIIIAAVDRRISELELVKEYLRHINEE